MSRRPLFILVSGQGGSGKTTMGRMLARHLGLSYYDYDSLVQPFLTTLQSRYPSPDGYAAFCSEWRDSCYNTLWNAVMDSLSLGVGVVASAPCTREWRQADFFSALKARYGVDCAVLSIELRPEPVRLKQQILRRGESRDQEKLCHWQRYVASLPAPAVWEPDARVLLTDHYGMDAPPPEVLELLNEME